MTALAHRVLCSTPQYFVRFCFVVLLFFFFQQAFSFDLIDRCIA